MKKRIGIGGHTGVRWSAGLACAVHAYAGHGRLLERAYLARQWRGYDQLTEQVDQSSSARNADTGAGQTCSAFAAPTRWI